MKKPKMDLKNYTGLVGAATNTTPKQADVEVLIASIAIKPQVRKQFNKEKLEQLAASILDQGVIEPVVLLEREDGTLELICGERRIKASLIAGLDKIPAVIKRNLSDAQIRKMQVAENKESDDISPFDEAMGVAEDVSKYGVEEACVIWNRSEGWVSKRVAVSTYPEPLRKLIEDGITGDYEVLGALNVLYGLDVNEFDHMQKRLVSGPALSRDEVRSKVANVKAWQKNQKNLEKVQKAQAPKSPPVADIKKIAAATPSSKDMESAAPVSELPASAGKRSASVTVLTPKKDLAQDRAEKQRAVLENNFRKLLVDIYDGADTNQSYFASLDTCLTGLECDMNQTDWAFWSAFQTLVLPMFTALGPERSARYLKRLVIELKSKEPTELWNDLHPTLDGSEDPGSARQEVAVMPPDWRF